MVRDRELMIRSVGEALDWDLDKKARPLPPQNKTAPFQKVTYAHNEIQVRNSGGEYK